MIFLKECLLQVNKRVVESLVIAGAFDELDSYHRAQYFDVIMQEEPILKSFCVTDNPSKTIKIRWKIHFC